MARSTNIPTTCPWALLTGPRRGADIQGNEFNMPDSIGPVTLGIINHLRELGYKASYQMDTVWHHKRYFVGAGEYVFTLDTYDSWLLLCVVATPVGRDLHTLFRWELADESSLPQLEQTLQFARINITTPLYMLLAP